MHRHRARQQATCLSVKPRILVGSTKKATVHICSGHREGRGGIALNSLGVSVQYGAHSSSLRHIFFCQSAYLNSFRWARGRGGEALRRMPQTPAGGPRSMGNTVAAQDGAPAAAPLHKRVRRCVGNHRRGRYICIHPSNPTNFPSNAKAPAYDAHMHRCRDSSLTCGQWSLCCNYLML